jgi:competence protein ComEA
MNRFKTLLFTLFLAFASLASAQSNERININTADVATLDRVMDGVGPAKAAAIVEHRRLHGPFRSVEQLVNVKGIGPATLELNRARIMVASSPAQPAPRVAAPIARRTPAAPGGR